MKKFEEVNKEYRKQQLAWKIHIKFEPSKWKRFWKRVLFWIAFPFVWIWVNIRDWRTAIIFVIVFLITSSEVWIPYLLGFVFYANEPVRITMFSVASACWLFWLGPGTPFMVICIGLTIAVKGLLNKIKGRKKK